MKRLYQIGRFAWLAVILGFAFYIYWAVDKIVGSHAFGVMLIFFFLIFAFGAGAPGISWFSSVKNRKLQLFGFWKSVWRTANLLCSALMIFSVGGVFLLFREIEKDLPNNFDAVTLYRPMLASRVLSRDGQVIGEFAIEKRYIVNLKDIPLHVREAFVAAEDKRFYEHRGIDLLGIARAAYANIKARRIKQGGSTITQQIAKLLITGNEKSFKRKIREAILARKIEKMMTKDQILAIYLNHVYLGHGAYGVAAAAEIYFSKDVSQLTLAEAALLAGAPKAPGANSPFSNFARAKERQAYVLREMVDAGFIDARMEKLTGEEPISIIAERDDWNWTIAPYFVEHIRKDVYRRYGKENLFGRGLQIRTSLDMQMQHAAERAVRVGLEDLSRRLGFSGPVGNVPASERAKFIIFPQMHPAIAGVEMMPQDIVLGQPYRALALERRDGNISLAIGRGTYNLDRIDVERIRRWEARLRPASVKTSAGEQGFGGQARKVGIGDIIPVKVEERDVGWGRRKRKIRIASLVETPTMQAALVAIDPATGEVRAMVGGYDYHQTQFNRATQAYRQAGSSIKPFVYTAAIEKGRTEVDIVLDAPIAVQTAGGVWAPRNYKGEFAGPVTLRTALAKSLNTVSVRLALEAGVPRVIEYMRKMGLEKSVIPRHISISLGTPDVSLTEMSASFASFPAGGKRVRPIFITSIKDADGRVLEERQSGIGEQVMSPETAYILVDMMKAVVTSGTGRKALELGRPTAGKTGTSTGFRDAWFVGYTADLVCGVWVGRDNFKPLGGDTTGGNTAAPIWVDFMRVAHPATAPRDFPAPPGIVFMRMNGMTGQRAKPGEWGSVLIPFKRGTVPRTFFSGTNDKFYREPVPHGPGDGGEISELQPTEAASQPTSSPASQPANSADRPASAPASNPASQPSSYPASRPISHPASQPASIPAEQESLPGGVEEPLAN